MSDYDQSGQCDLPLFRTCDPETSKTAADHIADRTGYLRDEFVRCLKQLGEPSTAQEVASISKYSKESVRKRAAECVAKNMIVKLGTKNCKVTGQRATAYWFA